MSFRPGSRIFNAFRPYFAQPLLRRRVGTSAAPEQTGFAKLWNSPVGPKTVHFWYVHLSRFLVLSHLSLRFARKRIPTRQLIIRASPERFRTLAPIMKWGLVIAGASDFARPAEQLSLTQNAALMSTGAIWTRWCFIIRPQNMFLAAVNFFLFMVGATQVGRILSYQRSVKATEGQVKSEGKELEGELKEVAQKAEKVVKS
ncbi:unnamed protein product [Periconia digitata]|uniref:Mitochondrial pyruvate carrier n=1 Tax=Periconia digitata TaxID=1303443 RepID=A0A9W4U3B1_9PLEO|nr:unnamed protein product [Periconia digitata]